MAMLEEDDGGGGIPEWVVTFGDLMSLLLCFFVLLLSFSEMDVAKFKQLSGSMKEANAPTAEAHLKRTSQRESSRASISTSLRSATQATDSARIGWSAKSRTRIVAPRGGTRSRIAMMNRSRALSACRTTFVV